MNAHRGKATPRYSRIRIGFIAGLCLSIGSASLSCSQSFNLPTTHAIQKGKATMIQASGSFEVKLTPQTPGDKAEGASTLGRFSLDKQFHGDLEAISKGEMLTAMTDIKDSAGYVAIERVNGTLHGRKGSFILQHSSTMTRGTPQQSVTVVPDSGTHQLAGLSGMMIIKIEDKKHFYDFEYTLPETR